MKSFWCLFINLSFPNHNISTSLLWFILTISYIVFYKTLFHVINIYLCLDIFCEFTIYIRYIASFPKRKKNTSCHHFYKDNIKISGSCLQFAKEFQFDNKKLMTDTNNDKYEGLANQIISARQYCDSFIVHNN